MPVCRRSGDAKYEVIDGHQRVKTVASYVGNEFALSGLGVLQEYKGRRFHQLPEREQRFLRTRTLRAIVITVESHPNMKFEIFERLNAGATSLNAQELRNSLYRGPLNRLLHELVKNSDFRAILGTRLPRPRMIDEELILRFLALHDHLDTYRPPLKRFLNGYMAERKTFAPEQSEATNALLATTAERVRLLIGEHAFRIAGGSGEALERSVNRALYDAQMLVASWIQDDGRSLADHGRALLQRLAQLYTSQTFLDAIQRATGDRTRTLTRVRGMVTAFGQVGMTLAVPFNLDR